MNKMPPQQLGRWAAIALIGLSVLSCKKDEPKPDPEPEPTDRTEGQYIKDEIYKYYKLYSLWADESIPDYLKNPAQFTDQWNSANAVLTQLRKLTPKHNAEGYNDGVFDRFSTMTGENNYDINSRAGLKMYNTEGYGISVQWFSVDDGATAQPYISFVEGGSPGAVAGFMRSDIITSVNDDKEDYSVGVTCEGHLCDVIPADEAKFSRLQSSIRFALTGLSLTLEVKRPENKLFKASMSYDYSYVINPIYKDTVFTRSGKHIGYFAYSSFEEIEDNGEDDNKDKTDALFAKFESKQISSLIVDLRYNGGGDVESGIYLANKIGGAKTAGKLMLTYEMNKYMSSDAASSLRKALRIYDTYFTATSGLRLDKVYFLVSEETASAAEMLINILVPHMDVKIIASGNRTFGKPVGFFEHEIKYNGTTKVSYWPASFLLKNSRGNLGEKYNKGTERNLRDYWDGLVPDIGDLGDDVSVAVGDPGDPMLAAALADAAPTAGTRAALRQASSRSIHMLEQGKISTLPERGMFKRMK